MLEEDMKKLEELKKELRAENRIHKAKMSPVKAEIKLLEADITRQVLQSGKTVIFGDLKAEFTPTVVFKMKKEKAE